MSTTPSNKSASSSNSVLKTGTDASHAIFSQNTAAVSGAKPSNSMTPTSESLKDTEAGADDETGLGEEEVMVVDAAAAEGASAGLFGGAAVTAAAGPGGIALGGAALLGTSSLSGAEEGGQDGIPVPPKPVLQVIEAQSTGVNVGPSSDGSMVLSASKTEAGALGSDKPVATITDLSVGNPDAPLPSGNPIGIDAENQVLTLNLGPLAQGTVDLDLNDLQNTALGFVDAVTSGDIELTEIVSLDVPTSIAGTEIPVTDTLNEVLSQLDAALTPVTDGLESLPLGASALTDGLAAVEGVPVLGDVLGQVTGVIDGGLPTGELALPVVPEIPMTGTPLDLATGQVTSAIGSLNSGEVPLADSLTSLLPVGG
jgi:hypothetical protein